MCFKISANALRLCEVPKKNGTKRGIFFGILQNRWEGYFQGTKLA